MPICMGPESRTRMEDLQVGCLWAVGLGRKSHDCVPFLLGSQLILSRYRPHPSSAPVLGGCLRVIYHQLGGQAADLAFTAHRGLLKMKAFSGKCSLQGSREEEEGKHS